MHELSIAISLLDVAYDEAVRRGVTVLAIHLRLGPLAGVVKEALVNAYDIARAESPLAEARLVIEEIPIRGRCAVCQREQPAVAVHDLRCAACGTPMPDIVSGRELEVFALETP
ncbi:MAG: hydrogenase maturation nickel metallochaperone HypA [Planctomycetota bacterium]